MTRYLKEPFVHFVLIGLGLFVLYAVVNDDQSLEDNAILISQGKVQNISVLFEKTWQRPPTEEELEALIEDHIKEEVFYREALRMGLDGDDIIIRRRMRQKMEFVAEDISAVVPPTQDELEDYLKEHQDKFAIEPMYTFRQVYLNPDLHKQDLDGDAANLLRRLQGTDGQIDPAQYGDRLMVDHRFVEVTPSEIGRSFGERFVESVESVPHGEWTGPVYSGFGIHLVIVDSYIPGRKPELEEVLTSVERELMNDRRISTLEAFYQGLRSQYEVVLEEDVEGIDTE